MPADAAVRAAPFFDVLTTAVTFANRFSTWLHPGVQVGTFIERRVRLAGRLVVFLSAPEDSHTQGDGRWLNLPGQFEFVASSRPDLLFGGSVGMAFASRQHFVLAPGLAYWSTSEVDYGHFLGMSLPFEWVTTGRMRMGFELDIGRGFAGNVTAVCRSAGTSTSQTCIDGETRTGERKDGPALYLHFQFGFADRDSDS